MFNGVWSSEFCLLSLDERLSIPSIFRSSQNDPILVTHVPTRGMSPRSFFNYGTEKVEKHRTQR